MELVTRLSRCLTGVSLGVGLLVLLNQLKIPFYLYYPRITHTVLISYSIDLYVFLISSGIILGNFARSPRKLSRSRLVIGLLAIWAVVVTLAIGRSYGIMSLYVTVMYVAIVDLSEADAQIQKTAVADVLVCTLSIFLLIEFSTLYYWIVSSVNPQGQVGFFSEELEANLTYSFSPLAMLMILLLLFSWFWIPITTRYSRPRKSSAVPNQSYVFGENVRSVVASLDLIAILAIFVFFYTYVAGQTWIVGFDSYLRYLEPLNGQVGRSLSQTLLTSNRHGFYIVLLYLVKEATGLSSYSIVKFAPLLFAFMTGSVILVAALRAGWSFQLAILSSICSLLWLPATMGIYTGIQTNWLALALWMAFLAFYFTDRRWNLIVYVVQGLISLAILLTHPWTWGIFLSNLILTAIISSRTVWARRCLQGLFAALATAIPMGIVAYQFLPGFRSDLALTLKDYTLFYLNPNSLFLFGNALTELMYGWASFLSPVLLLVSLIGAYSLTQRSGIARNYLLGWIATWCLGSVLVAPIGYSVNPLISESNLWRMLYVSPLPYLLAMGIEECLQLSKGFEVFYGAEPLSRKKTFMIISVLIAFSGGLFVAENALVRLLIVLGVLAILILVLVRFPKYHVERMFIASLLLLLVANAAFRSLYPLLLDPHNYLGSFVG